VQLTRSMDLAAPAAQSGQSDARLIPGGEPLGPVAQASTPTPGPSPASASASASTPTPGPAPRAASVVEQPVALAVAEAELPPLADQPPASVAMPEQVEAAPLPAAEPVLASAQDVPGPSFSLAAPASQVAPQPEPAAAPISLAEAFASFDLPPAPVRVQPAPGAVDITAIVPVREVRRPPPPPPSPPPPPPHPSRIWVQVATGQDVAAFRFDWRRLVREADGLLASREPYRARWGQTNRLVTGPFATTREANAFVSDLGEKGIDAFRFTSTAGEEVVALN